MRAARHHEEDQPQDLPEVVQPEQEQGRDGFHGGAAAGAGRRLREGRALVRRLLREGAGGLRPERRRRAGREGPLQEREPHGDVETAAVGEAEAEGQGRRGGRRLGRRRHLLLLVGAAGLQGRARAAAHPLHVAAQPPLQPHAVAAAAHQLGGDVHQDGGEGQGLGSHVQSEPGPERGAEGFSRPAVGDRVPGAEQLPQGLRVPARGPAPAPRGPRACRYRTCASGLHSVHRAFRRGDVPAGGAARLLSGHLFAHGGLRGPSAGGRRLLRRRRESGRPGPRGGPGDLRGPGGERPVDRHHRSHAAEPPSGARRRPPTLTVATSDADQSSPKELRGARRHRRPRGRKHALPFEF